MKTVGIILAGGIGERFGSKVPKQLMSLNGKKVIQYSIDAMKESKVIDHIIIVTPKEYADQMEKLDVNHVTFGGKTRTESVKNGLIACPEGTKYVLFHDAVRPFITAKHIRRCIEEVKEGTNFVVTTEPITDTLISVKGNYIKHAKDRNTYRLCQTPEAFDYEMVSRIYRGNKNSYQFISVPLIRKGYIGKTMPIEDINMKLTYAKDLFRAEQIIKYHDYILRTPNVEDKQILLLGGSGGIGQEVKRQLEDLGATVDSPSSTEFNLEEVPVYHKYYKKEYDCIIHCAGAYATDKEGLIKNYEKIMNVNFKSAVQLVELAQKGLLKSGGNIVLIGSTASSKGRKGISVYSASKSALNTFTEAISEDLKERKVKINVISPAKVNTRLQQQINPKADPNQMIQPEDIAKIIIGYCDVDFTGQVVYVKYGLEEK